MVAFARVLGEGEEDADAEIEAVEGDIEEDSDRDEDRPDHGEFDAEHGRQAPFSAALATPVASGDPGGSLVSSGVGSCVSGPLAMRRRM